MGLGLAGRAAATAGGGGDAGGALIEADFKAGTYTLEGTPVALLDLFPSISPEVTENVGLQVSAADSGNGVYSFGPEVGTDAYAAIANGYVAVVDLVYDYTFEDMLLAITFGNDWIHSPDEDALWAMSVSVSTDGGAEPTTDGQIGDVNGSSLIATQGAVTTLRAAWLMAPSGLSLSVNGGGAVTYEPMANPDRNLNVCTGQLFNMGPTAATATVERITFYAPGYVAAHPLAELSALDP